MRLTQPATYNARPVIVAMGWDEQIQGYFMTIEPVDPASTDADPESGMIYTNLDDNRIPFPGLPKDITHFKNVLVEMNIEVPPEFFGKVLSH